MILFEAFNTQVDLALLTSSYWLSSGFILSTYFASFLLSHYDWPVLLLSRRLNICCLLSFPHETLEQLMVKFHPELHLCPSPFFVVLSPDLMVDELSHQNVCV